MDRFISQYKHNLRSGKVSGELNLKNYEKAIKKCPQLLERGNYAKKLKNFIDIFGLGNMHIIIKEDIDNKPIKVLEDLYLFLEVNPNFVPPIVEKKVSPGITPKLKILEDLRIKIHSLSKKYAPWFIDFVKKYRIVELYRKINSKKGFQIEEEVREKLHQYYEEEIINTEKLIKKDLGIWEK